MFEQFGKKSHISDVRILQKCHTFFQSESSAPFLFVYMFVGDVPYIFLIFKFHLQEIILLILLFTTKENLVFLNKPSLQSSQNFTCKYDIKISFCVCVYKC